MKPSVEKLTIVLDNPSRFTIFTEHTCACIGTIENDVLTVTIHGGAHSVEVPVDYVTKPEPRDTVFRNMIESIICIIPYAKEVQFTVPAIKGERRFGMLAMLYMKLYEFIVNLYKIYSTWNEPNFEKLDTPVTEELHVKPFGSNNGLIALYTKDGFEKQSALCTVAFDKSERELLFSITLDNVIRCMNVCTYKSHDQLSEENKIMLKTLFPKTVKYIFIHGNWAVDDEFIDVFMKFIVCWYRYAYCKDPKIHTKESAIII